MPSEYCTSPPVPGNSLGVEAGTCDRSVGKVTGKWPLGLVWPNSTDARAVPLLSPGYQASTTEETWLIQGIVTGAPASTTTTVCGLAAATAEISSFCADGRLRLARAAPPGPAASGTTTPGVVGHAGHRGGGRLRRGDRLRDPRRQVGRGGPAQRGRRPAAEKGQRVGLAGRQVDADRVGGDRR